MHYLASYLNALSYRMGYLDELNPNDIVSMWSMREHILVIRVSIRHKIFHLKKYQIDLSIWRLSEIQKHNMGRKSRQDVRIHKVITFFGYP